MTVKEFDKLDKKDFRNRDIIIEIRNSLKRLEEIEAELTKWQEMEWNQREKKIFYMEEYSKTLSELNKLKGIKYD